MLRALCSFMESELELDEEIKRFAELAAAPELYPTFVELGAVGSLLGLLAHDNVDVALEVVDLLSELTDVDEGEGSEGALALVDALVSEDVEGGGGEEACLTRRPR